MGDASNPTRNDGGQPLPDVLEITVRMDVKTGLVEVSGSVANPVFALGLLEYALLLIKRQDALRAAVDAQTRILPAAIVPRRIS